MMRKLSWLALMVALAAPAAAAWAGDAKAGGPGKGDAPACGCPLCCEHACPR
ncbi:MAG TPA: hypothetical protein VE075_12130 [Thermoanaerobaculia bacterium]|nr:hypothetical protein [Thermoanaerobaculia bacterium]